jgi:hypothetical protein
VEIDLTDQPLEQPERAQLEALPDEVRVELEEAVDLCVNLVSEEPGTTRLYETKIHSDLLEEHGGTIDVILVDGNSLHVIDFKFGRTRVEIENNAQIKCYLNLARQLFPEATEFYGSIIQPAFSNQIQTMDFPLHELLQHEADVLEASISDHLKAGDHCKWCPAGPTCQVLAEYLRAQVEEFPDLTQLVSDARSNPTDEQIEQLCKIYKTFKLVENQTKGAGAILKEWARKGSDIEVHGLSVRLTHRKYWKKDAKLPQELVKVTFETPAQAQKILNLDKDEFEAKFGDRLDLVESHALVMGRKAADKEFPEFD